ncbi:MAG: 50S ribosomal protein L27 [Patescibacteria group bacterium]
MASKKAGGSAKNLSDSNAQYLGIKLYAGEKAKIGNVIVRQRGTHIMAGTNVSVGKDHTLFASKDGIVSYGTKRKTHFNGKTIIKKVVNVK